MNTREKSASIQQEVLDSFMQRVRATSELLQPQVADALEQLATEQKLADHEAVATALRKLLEDHHAATDT